MRYTREQKTMLVVKSKANNHWTTRLHSFASGVNAAEKTGHRVARRACHSDTRTECRAAASRVNSSWFTRVCCRLLSRTHAFHFLDREDNALLLIYASKTTR